MFRIFKNLIWSLLFILSASVQAQPPSISDLETIFLDFIWEKNSIRLVKTTPSPVSVKHRQPTELSAQHLYYELTSDGKILFSGLIKNPKMVHVEYADHNGTLYRQEAILDTVAFTIRIPAFESVESIKIFQVQKPRSARLRNNVALDLQPDLKLIHEVHLNLNKENDNQ